MMTPKVYQHTDPASVCHLCGGSWEQISISANADQRASLSIQIGYTSEANLIEVICGRRILKEGKTDHM